MSAAEHIEFTLPKCKVETPTGACGETQIITRGACLFHSTLRDVRDLTPRQFKRLRKALATTVPLSDDERRERRVKSALSLVRMYSGNLRDAERRARDAGATQGQILDARMAEVSR